MANIIKTILECQDITKVWENEESEVVAIKNLSIEVKEGEVLAIIGPSGCGKSTLLEVLAGLELPTSGLVQSHSNNSMGTRKDVTLINQRLYLFDWVTVRGNIELPLRWFGIPAKERQERSFIMIERLGLKGFENIYPYQLSAGMQHRAAIARALILEPKVLLMDESLGSLDSQTRMLMQKFLLDVINETKTTLVYVTHLIDEAVFLADRVVVLKARPGRIKETILIELSKPRDRYSSEFELLSKKIFDLVTEEVGSIL
ncbi:MAG: ABC transporter ATP-binding protein [Ignavibacteriae bacterium]|nr:ABC transporter ATP-binding protein [Ignavibacteria bacterium]MBI3365269.1 ABC transporter ATP-binding protein [Ignavibacteriota bacterium]